MEKKLMSDIQKNMERKSSPSRYSQSKKTNQNQINQKSDLSQLSNKLFGLFRERTSTPLNKERGPVQEP